MTILIVLPAAQAKETNARSTLTAGAVAGAWDLTRTMVQIGATAILALVVVAEAEEEAEDVM